MNELALSLTLPSKLARSRPIKFELIRMQLNSIMSQQL
jgi:hypothetical protein